MENTKLEKLHKDPKSLTKKDAKAQGFLTKLLEWFLPVTQLGYMDAS